jgi:hypothetical protein
MRVYPLMNIRFPYASEAELVDALKARAIAPWRWQERNANARPPDDDFFYFHRDRVGADPPCTVCLWRVRPANFAVVNILPDAKTVVRLTVDQYVGILRDFDRSIAEPAADAVEGMTSIDTDKRRLEDYFGPQAIRFLECFCKTSNASTLGSHPSDQRKWMAFLLCVHRRNAEPVHGDIFGECLKAKGWRPDRGISRLVQECDFAMELLRLSDRTSEKGR